MTPTQWSWILLPIFLLLMIGLGIAGRRRVKTADDFAVARRSYGPLVLALAFAATTASGATFIGFPGLSYTIGVPALASAVLYPAGVYLGVLICMRMVNRCGQMFGSRSIPEFLGERYQSEAIRILVSLFSLLLLFYLAGQLVSGLVIFEIMLGLSPALALGITSSVLLLYVVLGGAHADIMTDGIQGLVMLLVALLVVVIFAGGFGVGGFDRMIERLAAQDPGLIGFFSPSMALYHSWWSWLAILLAHVPLGMLPHIGNKLWALRENRQQMRFLRYAALFGFLLGLLGLGGILARAVLGDVLLHDGATPNSALPLLFIELFPPWLSAFLGVGVLAAIMSTADGLVISSSQIVANDIYRLSVLPRLKRPLDVGAADRRVLMISRGATIAVMLVCTLMAWYMLDHNVALIIWIGTGGLMAAFAGPLVLGAMWPGVTKAGAMAGLVSGAAVFAILHAGLIEPAWFADTYIYPAAQWLESEAPSPFSCAAIGECVSLAVTWLVSLQSRRLPADHLESLFSYPGRGPKNEGQSCHDASR